ncbi:hypothetical protein ACFQ8O_10350 [Streptomyces coelicoflavus]|uniref:hypothetical protein n=1 Tax=Streptomyces coelicoflavus TaxID=285562 RepID=UPI00369C9549
MRDASAGSVTADAEGLVRSGVVDGPTGRESGEAPQGQDRGGHENGEDDQESELALAEQLLAGVDLRATTLITRIVALAHHAVRDDQD